jgi:hypothetical protein
MRHIDNSRKTLGANKNPNLEITDSIKKLEEKFESLLKKNNLDIKQLKNELDELKNSNKGMASTNSHTSLPWLH